MKDTENRPKPRAPIKSNPRPAHPDDRKWRNAQALCDSDTVIEVLVEDVSFNRDGQARGLTVNLFDLPAFLPGREQPSRVTNVDAKGTLVKVKVLEVDRAKRRLIVTQRGAIENTRKEFLASLTAGSEVRATVLRVTEFGYFCNIGTDENPAPVDALLHHSQMPLVDETPPVFAPGDVVTATIRYADLDKIRLALTMLDDAASATAETEAPTATEVLSAAPAIEAAEPLETAALSETQEKAAPASDKSAPSNRKRKRIRKHAGSTSKSADRTPRFKSFEELAKFLAQQPGEQTDANSDESVPDTGAQN